MTASCTSKLESAVDAQCEQCHWTGSPSDCETYQEQESPETRPYTVAICPKCGSEEVHFHERPTDDESERVQLT